MRHARRSVHRWNNSSSSGGGDGTESKLVGVTVFATIAAAVVARLLTSVHGNYNYQAFVWCVCRIKGYRNTHWSICMLYMYYKNIFPVYFLIEYIYMYTHTHIYMYTHTYIYVYTHTYMYMYTHTHICVNQEYVFGYFLLPIVSHIYIHLPITMHYAHIYVCVIICLCFLDQY